MLFEETLISLSLKIAEELQLSADDHNSIVIVALLFHKIMQEMPQTFKAIDPNSLDQKDYKIYFNNYFEQLDKLKKIEALKKYVTFLSEIWEHFDGSGLPNGFKDNKVPKISQIINLSLSYHIGVYKIYDNETSSHKMNTEFFQTPEKTIQRHANTVHIIFKNSSWYDFDVIDTDRKSVV